MNIAKSDLKSRSWLVPALGLVVITRAVFTPRDIAEGAGGRRGGRGSVRDTTVALLKSLMAAQ